MCLRGSVRANDQCFRKTVDTFKNASAFAGLGGLTKKVMKGKLAGCSIHVEDQHLNDQRRGF